VCIASRRKGVDGVGKGSLTVFFCGLLLGLLDDVVVVVIVVVVIIL
jgi:hypothetical protein